MRDARFNFMAISPASGFAPFAIESRDNWQLEETNPAPIWETVIVYDPTAFRRMSHHKVFTAVKMDDGRWWLGYGDFYMKNAPTHWQPLPEGPDDAK